MPPHHHHHHHHGPRHPHHHRERVLDALDILNDCGKLKSVADLIGAVEQIDEPELASALREAVDEFRNVHSALDWLRDHVHTLVHHRNNGFLRDWNGRRVGMIFPLPPHVHEPFMTLPGVTVMVAPGHHLPPHLRHMRNGIVTDPRSCRRAVSTLDVIVFEAYRDRKTYMVDTGVADILDPHVIPASAQLVVHLRPHPHPEDVELEPPTNSITLL